MRITGRVSRHEVRLVPAHVKAYVRGNKNDYNDARAIGEAVQRPDMRLVRVKTVEQQDVQAMHRMREARVKERTALCNQTRGLLAEYGIVVAQGVGALRRRVQVLEDAENGLSDFLRPLLSRSYEQMCELDAHIEFYTRAVHEHARRNNPVADGAGVRRCHGERVPSWATGASFAAGAQWGQDGAVGHQQARGPVLALFVGAWSAFGPPTRGAARGPAGRWATRLKATRGTHKATVALANKMARIGWAVAREPRCSGRPE